LIERRSANQSHPFGAPLKLPIVLSHFAHPDVTDQLSQRLLLITYAYPPDLEVGALRWQKFTRYGFEMGWGMDVVTRDAREHARTDDAGLRDLPPGTRIIGVSHQPRGLLKAHRGALALRDRLRRTAGVHNSSESGEQRAIVSPPTRSEQSTLRELKANYMALVDLDHYRRWSHAAFRAALRVFDPRVHRAVVTSGPPHMAHEAGRLLSRTSGLPLVADFRDLWSGVERLDLVGALWHRFAEYYERRVIDQARLVVTTTEPAADWLRDAYPAHAQRVITVMNGCDDEPELPSPTATNRFVIAFSGSIYLDRSPVELFRAAADVVRSLRLEPSDFGIELIGDVSHFNGNRVIDIADEAGIKDFVQLHSKRPRNQLYELLATAAMLVNLPQDSHRAIPAKVFEYMRFPAWLLVLAEPESATARLFVGTKADVVSPLDVSRIAAVIRERYLAFRSGVRPAPVCDQGPFSRRMQARRLFSAIENIVNTGPGDSSDSKESSVRSGALSPASASSQVP